MKWLIIIPGVYFLGLFFTYWLISRWYPSQSDEEMDKVAAFFWPICLPITLISILCCGLCDLLDLIRPK